MGNASVTSAAHEKVEIMSQNTGTANQSSGQKEKLTAEQLRKRGNELHDARRFQEAIESYTKAIIKDASVPTYYTNRALCYMRLQRWDLVCKDCNTAIERDPSCLKAYYFMGVAMMEKNNYDEALNLLQKANDLATKQRQCYGDEITCMIRICRKRRWTRQEEKRMQQEIDLQMYIHKLIEEEKSRQIEELLHGATEGPSSIPATTLSSATSGSRGGAGSGDAASFLGRGGIPAVSNQTVISPIPTDVFPAPVIATAWGVAVSSAGGDPLNQTTAAAPSGVDVGQSSQSSSVDPITERKIAEVERFHQEKKMELDRLLSEMDDRRKKRDVPDYLCGKISFELMRDPVITPSGITYDRRDIDEHLRRVGHFDPVTRMELTHDQLIPNLAMKEVVDHFLSLNEWAIDY